MPHRSLLDAIAGRGVPTAQSLFTQLKRYYRLAAKDELEIVETLASASLLRSDKNWKFAHDAYEEFFAASRLRSALAPSQPCPISDKWMTRPRELDEVFSYLRELIAEERPSGLRPGQISGNRSSCTRTDNALAVGLPRSPATRVISHNIGSHLARGPEPLSLGSYVIRLAPRGTACPLA